MVSYNDKPKAVTAEDLMRRYNLEEINRSKKAITTLNDNLTKTNANLDRKKAYSVILTNCNSCEIATYLKLLKTSDLSESEFYGLVRQAGKKYNGASRDIIAQIDRFNLPEKSIKQLYIDMFINLDTATERARESMLDFD